MCVHNDSIAIVTPIIGGAVHIYIAACDKARHLSGLRHSNLIRNLCIDAGSSSRTLQRSKESASEFEGADKLS